VPQESKDHIQNFLNWKDLGNWSLSSQAEKTLVAHNPLCGDQITLYCNTNELGLKIVSMTSEACSVCLASAGILYGKGSEWNLKSLISYQTQIEDFLNGNGNLLNLGLDEINFWNTMKSNPGRHRCAFLPYVALKKGL
jgi:NifU-like protein involved in Fe-S cluster formation